MAAQRNADGVYFEIVVDLFRNFADQLVHVRAGEHGVGDGDQNAEVVALAAQQVVIDVIGDAALDLLRDDGHNLGKGVQALVFRLARGWSVVRINSQPPYLAPAASGSMQ